MAFVIDNSIVMSWCFEDESNAYADSVLDCLMKTSAVVPSIWPLEVVNVLLVAQRRKRISQSASSQFLSLLNELPVFVEYDRIEKKMKELLALAMTNNLSSYDASYLELAMEKGLSIATLDNKLIKAANRIDVPLFSI